MNDPLAEAERKVCGLEAMLRAASESRRRINEGLLEELRPLFADTAASLTVSELETPPSEGIPPGEALARRVLGVLSDLRFCLDNEPSHCQDPGSYLHGLANRVGSCRGPISKWRKEIEAKLVFQPGPETLEAAPRSLLDVPVYLGDGSLLVAGETLRLEEREAETLEALIDHGPLKKDELVGKSGNDDAVKVLRNLKHKYRALQSHIQLPGGKGKGGYRTTIRRQ